jgi:hypothetical protein
MLKFPQYQEGKGTVWSSLTSSGVDTWQHIIMFRMNMRL